ncbi:MAG: KEOPS complex subunit Pcc1 [Methanosarcinales archaeon Met12]|nr:MAG: KEOPS complex subunit Pcc1 [Methanosarcinales archaeon Met12]
MRRMYSQFEFDLGKHVDNVYRSLLPELKDAPSQRVEVNLELRNDMVKLHINSDDIVSFRAALNTWLRLVKVAYDMAKWKTA